LPQNELLFDKSRAVETLVELSLRSEPDNNKEQFGHSANAGDI